MTEVDYQLECDRADLLGLPKPTWEEFKAKIETLPKASQEEEITVEEAEEMNTRKEGLTRIGGGLDELNSILLSTQKKLNSFKTVCGSFSRIFKLRNGAKGGDENKEEPSLTDINKVKTEDSNADSCEDEKKNIPITKKTTNSEFDKLDSLISKAERAELSLSSQNKQMKKFLN